MNSQKYLPCLALNGPGPSGLGEQADLSFIYYLSRVFKLQEREALLYNETAPVHADKFDRFELLILKTNSRNFS